MKKEKISIVVPCFNEEDSLPMFMDELNKVINNFKYKVTFEIVFVDDGSKDNTLSVIKKMCKNCSYANYISFSKNFGKEAAMYAGLSNACGDYVTLMDADLQDPPRLLEEMYYEIKYNHYDSVGLRRVNRKGEPVIRSFFANCFYKLIKVISKTEMVSGARDYRLMTRQVVDSILMMKEYNRYSKGLFSFVGFNTKWLNYQNEKRVAGKTKWNFWKLLVYAFDAIIAFSTAPLAISVFIGMLLCFLSFIMILVIVLKTIIFGDPVSGWPSLVCILFFLSGIQLFCIGICSAYLSKAYLEVKNRPIFIVKDTSLKKLKN